MARRLLAILILLGIPTHTTAQRAGADDQE